VIAALREGDAVRYFSVAGFTVLFVWLNSVDGTRQSGEAQFDAVTIKRSTSRQLAMRHRHTAGREIFENTPVEQLLIEAYGADERELMPVPDWVKSERYDIVATYTANPKWTTHQPVQRMLQVLLEERFAVEAQRGPGMLRVDHIERPATN
jgi:uncharacterized protein (TIGR03435 family)